MQVNSPNKDHERALGELKVRDPQRRATAAVNLGIYGNADVIPALVDAAQDDSEFVRVSALYSLVLLGHAESVAKLIAYVGHKRTHFRKLALKALETATGKNQGGPFDDEKACAKAAQGWADWWKTSQPKVKWDAQKKVYA